MPPLQNCFEIGADNFLDPADRCIIRKMVHSPTDGFQPSIFPHSVKRARVNSRTKGLCRSEDSSAFLECSNCLFESGALIIIFLSFHDINTNTCYFMLAFLSDKIALSSEKQGIAALTFSCCSLIVIPVARGGFTESGKSVLQPLEPEPGNAGGGKRHDCTM